MNTNTNPVDSVNTNEPKMIKEYNMTVAEFADSQGIEYLQASALMGFLVAQRIAKENGNAPKEARTRGKPSKLYTIPAEAEIVFFSDDEAVPNEVPPVPEVVPVAPEVAPEVTPEVVAPVTAEIAPQIAPQEQVAA